MANSSFPVLKKLDSVPNCNEQPCAPVFKIPSPFWNQESVFRRSRHVRESTPNVAVDAMTLYPYRYDLGSMRNPDISCVTGLNHIYSMNSMNASSRYITAPSKFLASDPNTLHSIGRGTYYWSYLTSGVEDGLAKGFRNVHNPQIDPFLASYYYRGAERDVLPREEGSQKKRPKDEMYWYHEPQKQRILHGPKKMHYVKSYPHPGSSKTNHHQHRSSPATPEESKRVGENQTEEALPLLDRREDAEKQNHQKYPSSCPESSSSVLCVLHRFVEGSLVELEGGRLKRVEDLRMEDLEKCAELHPELRLERFTVSKITPSHTPVSLLHVELERDHSQLCLEANEGLPFFVCGRGWSSCNPQHTSQTCRLQCHQLKVGDVCVALTREPAPLSEPADQSPAELNTDHTVPKCDMEKQSTLPRKYTSRKRHFTAPELRDISMVHQVTD